MAAVLRPKFRAAMRARAHRRYQLALPPAMRIERSGAVGTNDAQVLESIVVADPVRVVEDESHPPPTPDFALAAYFANRLLDPLVIKAELEIAPRIGRIPNEDVLERLALLPLAKSFSARRIRIEMLRRDAPLPGPSFECSRVGAGCAIPEVAQCLRPGASACDGLSGLLLAEARRASAWPVRREMAHVDLPQGGPLANCPEVLAERREAEEAQRVRPSGRKSEGLRRLFLRITRPPWHEHMFAHLPDGTGP